MSRLDGAVLQLARVERAQAGIYLCIAGNGNPPMVSRRVQLDVKCEYRPQVTSVAT